MLKRHAFSFGLQDNPPERARTISDKAPPRPKMGLVSDRVFGEYQSCDRSDLPRLCRDTGPPSLAGSVFLGLGKLRVFGRDAPICRLGLIAESVNALRRRDS